MYDKYIHTSSPHRSVLSVHVKSQIESSLPGFGEQLAEGVRLFIANEGYDVPPSEVAESIKGDLSQLPQRLFAVIVKHGYDQERALQSLEKGAEMFKAQTEVNGEPNGEVKHKPEGLREIKIQDMKAFRKTLKLDEKPTPVQPLEIYYESQSPRL